MGTISSVKISKSDSENFSKIFLPKLENSGLVGRGGASFPVNKKWEMVRESSGEKKYVICNGSEGEPGVKKDGYLLEKFPEDVINGVKIAMKYINAAEGIIYLNSEYYKRFSKKLAKVIGSSPISVFKKPEEAGYVGGVETALLDVIEGKMAQPRLRPPFPVSKGLFASPTLINNVETFYDVSLISKDKYLKNRLYTIGGDCKNAGVFEFPEDETIENILKKTGNYPSELFFVQVGGDASGEVLNSSQLGKKVSGAGSVTVHSIDKHEPMTLMETWTDFFKKESCGKCTPCREGTFRLKEMIYSEDPDWRLFIKLLENLKETAFCGLGSSVNIPFFTYFKNVLPILPKYKISRIRSDQQLIKVLKKVSI